MRKNIFARLFSTSFQFLRRSDGVPQKTRHYFRRRNGLKGKVAEYKHYKEEAREIIEERLLFFANFYGVTYARLAIRNQETRWGSCSSKSNLNFHYKVAYLPLALRDYVIVHEVCHLIHHHHGALFWSEVARVVPNYRVLRRELSKYSSMVIPPVTHE